MAGYDQWILRDYRYFQLFLNIDQRYLGRAYAWLTRAGDMQRYSGLSIEELLELHLIVREYESVLRRLWLPDHMNYAWLGNEFKSHKGHGHMHFIPRYMAPRTFKGVEFVDENWERNYAPYNTFQVPDEVLVAIRDELRGAL
jgi:diadenosine tetraphosphate (Ap4A) HIT family hydrolase